jgi:ketosteroid isomerase-like protein
MPPHDVVDAVRDALNNADLERFKEAAHPDVVFVPRRAATEGEFVGYEGFARFLADNEQIFEVFEGVVEEMPLVREDLVVIAGHVRVRGRGGGAETTVPYAMVIRLEDGKATRIQADYTDREAALADARGYPPVR